MEKIRSHRELKVYQKSFENAMKIYQLSKSFPKEETYSLTDQITKIITFSEWTIYQKHLGDENIQSHSQIN